MQIADTSTECLHFLEASTPYGSGSHLEKLLRKQSNPTLSKQSNYHFTIKTPWKIIESIMKQSKSHVTVKSSCCQFTPAIKFIAD